MAKQQTCKMFWDKIKNQVVDLSLTHLSFYSLLGTSILGVRNVSLKFKTAINDV